MKLSLVSTLFALTALWGSAAPMLPADSLATPADSLFRDDVNVLAAAEEKSPYTFVNGVLPPTPQAAALARYGEHPVDLSTGLVDISVPVYTIRLGDFELPVTLSYHASGIKVTDMSTSVGLGWVLNAGGAISRSICGAPDLRYNASP